MEQWLKTTIPGIIILGAVGSILAFVFLRLLAKLVSAIPIGKRILLHIASFTAYRHGFVAGALQASENVFGSVAFFSYLLMRAGIAALFGILSYLSLFTIFVAGDPGRYPLWALLFSFVGFTSMIVSGYFCSLIRMHYVEIIEPILKAAGEKVTCSP